MSTPICGFIGLGLIGGSIAKALRKAYPDMRIIAYDIDIATLKLAKAEGILSEGFTNIGSQFSSCDFLFLCAPVSHNAQNLQLIKQYISPDAILTDVGSVKTDIHAHIEQSGLTSQFIGGHPMAGSERTGYLNSKPGLLENAYYILTPTEKVSPHKITAYEELVKSMGAIPLTLSYSFHDYATAAISHLPHVVSAALVNLVKHSDSPDGLMQLIAAGGFKDITRISSSSPVMWQQICLTNKDNISELLQNYIDELTAVKKQIDSSSAEELYDFFDEARTYRDAFQTFSSGPIKRLYRIKVDIPDTPGALANIVNLLSEQKINIKNIGITHNREYEEGVLSLEFYEEKNIEISSQLLTIHGYNVHA